MRAKIPALPTTPDCSKAQLSADGLHRLVSVAESPGDVYAYAYDLAGNRTAARRNGALVQSYQYGAANQVRIADSR
jgi:YD repeat-containing protein